MEQSKINKYFFLAGEYLINSDKIKYFQFVDNEMTIEFDDSTSLKIVGKNSKEIENWMGEIGFKLDSPIIEGLKI